MPLSGVDGVSTVPTLLLSLGRTPHSTAMAPVPGFRGVLQFHEQTSCLPVTAASGFKMQFCLISPLTDQLIALSSLSSVDERDVTLVMH